MSPLPSVEFFAPMGPSPFRRFPVGRALRKPCPPLEWILEDFIPRGMVGVLAGRPNCGKSMLAIQLSLATAAGLQLPGFSDIRKPLGVLYIAMEDDETTLHGRLERTVCQMTGISPRNLERRVRRNLRILNPDLTLGSARLSLLANQRQIVQECQDMPGPVGLIVLDTQSAMFDGEENNTSDTTEFWAACQAIAKETGATVLVIHHVRKSSASERPENRPVSERLNPENLRGASAIEGRARFVLLMTCLQPQEAQKIGLPSQDAMREAFVVLASVKQSASSKGAWVLLERGAAGMPDAGLLHLHSESMGLTSALRDKGGNQGQGKARQAAPRNLMLLQAIAFAGSLEQVNREAVASVLWPGEAFPPKRWDKLLEILRSKGLMQGKSITLAGRNALKTSSCAQE